MHKNVLIILYVQPNRTIIQFLTKFYIGRSLENFPYTKGRVVQRGACKKVKKHQRVHFFFNAIIISKLYKEIPKRKIYELLLHFSYHQDLLSEFKTLFSFKTVNNTKIWQNAWMFSIRGSNLDSYRSITSQERSAF